MLTIVNCRCTTRLLEVAPMFYRVRNPLRERLYSALLDLYSFASYGQYITIRLSDIQAVSLMCAAAEVLCRKYENNVADDPTVTAFNVLHNRLREAGATGYAQLDKVWVVLDTIRR